MQQLDVANTYNFALYLTHYNAHLDQIETVRNIGDLDQMSMLEMLHLMPGTDTIGSINYEIGNMAPDDYVEDGIFTRICT
jgi:hypothetical protein